MKKQDFKLMYDVANVIPKMMEMSDSMFIAVICSSISTYANSHDIDISEMIARVTGTLICSELELEDEDDNE